MKKSITYFALFASLISFAQTFTVDNINYQVNTSDPTTVAITSSDVTGDLMIPDEVIDPNDATIQYTITDINDNAFRGKNLTSIVFPTTSPLTIRRNAFRDNEAISSLTFPANIVGFLKEAFRGCTGVRTITCLGTTPASIDNSIFTDENLIDLIIPEGTLEAYVDAGWQGFKTTNGNVGVGNPFEADNLFYLITSIEPFLTVAVTGGDINNENRNLTIPATVTFGEHEYTVTSVGSEAFLSKRLTGLVLPNTLERLDFRAFRNNKGLTEVIIPESVVSFGTEAFRDCTGIRTITCLGTTPAGINDNRFADETLIDLTIPEGTLQAYLDAGWSGFKTTNGVIGVGNAFKVDNLFYLVTGVESNAPKDTNTVTVTGGGAFNRDLIIPATVTFGEEEAVTYTVTSVGSQAFRNKGLTGLVLPNTLESLDFRAFRDNKNLTEVVIPASVTTIATESFFRGGLTKLTMLNPTPISSINGSTFGNRSVIDLFVPAGSLTAYQESGDWTGFKSITTDTQAPTITSIVRKTPTEAVTNADVLVWEITFDEPVLNCVADIVDFEVTSEGEGAVDIPNNNVTGRGTNVLTITTPAVDGLDNFNGEVTLSFKDGHRVRDLADNSLTNLTPSGANEVTYTLDNTAPSIQSIALVGTPNQNATTVDYTVTFSENANNISIDDFELTFTGSATGNIASVSTDSGNSVTVTVDEISAFNNGSIRLDLKSDTDITDVVGNGNITAFTTGSIHTIDFGTLDTDVISNEGLSISLFPSVLKINTIDNVDEIVILDVTASIVAKTKNSKTITFDTLSSGIYFVKVKTKQGIVTKKFIKK